MTSRHRVWVIYRKELLEILRDRRTLTAMIVIPVVLYPLLMLGFLRAAESEEVRLKSRKFVVEVDDFQAVADLNSIVAAVRKHQANQDKANQYNKSPQTSPKLTNPKLTSPKLTNPKLTSPKLTSPKRKRGSSAGTGIPTRSHVSRESLPATAPAESAESRATFDIRVGFTPTNQLGDEVQLRVRLSNGTAIAGSTAIAQAAVCVTYNEVNINSRAAMEQFSDVLRDFRDISIRRRVQELIVGKSLWTGMPSIDIDTVLEPVRIDTVSIATERQRGGWALGQIIPIILVLMTITGSIYPAIDLTAGERERGTLETLMATPVPPLQLILGKFLVVASIGMITAFLNVASVGATMHFSGLTRSITQSMPVEIPIAVLPIVLLTMIPFSLLFAAILIAVCSFARTFKEAQSYVMPVIIGAMIPAFAVTLPTARLTGVLLVLPVGNMVLLARELFQESYTWSQVAIVLISTTFYAAAAVAIAVRLFGQEAVVFADSGSYKTLLLRRYYRPSARPTLSQALLVAALVFPASFYAQSLLSGPGDGDFIKTLKLLAFAQFAGLFVLLPLCITTYYKIDLVETFRLRLPPIRAWFAAILLGCSSWAIAHEIVAFQARLAPPSDAMQQAFKTIEQQLAAAPLWQVLLLMAIVPAVTEEFFFRGFLLSGLSQGLRKWPAILIAALTFGIYHFIVDRVPVTAMLGVVLAYLCWQSRSLLPAIVFHAMHNGLLMWLNARYPETIARLGLPDTITGFLPSRVVLPAIVLFVAGISIAASIRQRPRQDVAT